jgi:hypothetical protein
MNLEVLTAGTIERRKRWVSQIVKISGKFGEDAARVEQELIDEVRVEGSVALLDHLRVCGAMPECLGHDSSEEKLYSKYTDALLAVAFRFLDLTAVIYVERADVADVEVEGAGLEFVADAKAFRLSRTAKNQKDFKVQAMDGWKQGKPHAMVVCPLYQVPTKKSQIYQQAVARNVCVASYSHLAVLVALAAGKGPKIAQRALKDMLQAVKAMKPSKDSASYWTSLNRAMLDSHVAVSEYWKVEKAAMLDAINIARKEGLEHLAALRDEIMKLDRAQAIERLLKGEKIKAREKKISRVSDNGLLGLR